MDKNGDWEDDTRSVSHVRQRTLLEGRKPAKIGAMKRSLKIFGNFNEKVHQKGDLEKIVAT